MQGSTLVLVCYRCCGEVRADCPRCHGSGADPGNLPLTKNDFITESLLRLGFARLCAVAGVALYSVSTADAVETAAERTARKEAARKVASVDPEDFDLYIRTAPYATVGAESQPVSALPSSK